MAFVCPRCATPAAVSVEIVQSAGRMLRCNRCATTWFARVASADPLKSGDGAPTYLSASRANRPRFEQIIEHDVPRQSWRETARAVWRASSGFAPGRRVVVAVLGVAVVIGGLGVALAVQSAVVGVSPTAETAQFAGLEIRLIRAAVERLQNGNTVVVEGEIANRTDADIAVPAVRIALLSDGVERRTWIHQPTETRLGGRDAVTFRSLLASPPAGVDEVTFRLADRPDLVVGMH